MGQALVTLARPAVWDWPWQEGGRATSETELTRSRWSLILQLRESRPKAVKWFWSRSHSSQMTSLALSAGLWALAPCSSHHTNISSWLETVSMVRPSHQDPNHPVGKSHITGQLKKWGHFLWIQMSQLPKIIPFQSKAKDKSILSHLLTFPFSTLLCQLHSKARANVLLSLTSVNQLVSTCYVRTLAASQTSWKPAWTSDRHTMLREQVIKYEPCRPRVTSTRQRTHWKRGSNFWAFSQKKQCFPSLWPRLSRENRCFLEKM